jgi:hypothetical protein
MQSSFNQCCVFEGREGRGNHFYAQVESGDSSALSGKHRLVPHFDRILALDTFAMTTKRVTFQEGSLGLAAVEYHHIPGRSSGLKVKMLDVQGGQARALGVVEGDIICGVNDSYFTNNAQSQDQLIAIIKQMPRPVIVNINSIEKIDGDGNLLEISHVYENEMKIPFRGFSSSHLPSGTRGRFSSGNGHFKYPTLDHFEKPSEAWTWQVDYTNCIRFNLHLLLICWCAFLAQGGWAVDQGYTTTDQEGWVYGSTFKEIEQQLTSGGGCCAVPKATHMVRRKKLIRARSMDKAAYAEQHKDARAREQRIREAVQAHERTVDAAYR